MHVWGNLLVRKYAGTHWAIHADADADEFLRIPEGPSIQDMAARLDASGCNAAWSVMLDLYPRRFRDLAAMRADSALDRGGVWYFDARPHFCVLDGRRPRRRHAGSRARLMRRFGIHRARCLRQWNEPGSWVALLRGMATIPRYNEILKTLLFKRPADGWFRTNHDPAFPIEADCLLPFEHYKLTGDLLRRFPDAITSRAYADNSARYADLNRLLCVMKRRDATFLCPYSQRAGAFGAYLACGVAQGDDLSLGA